MATAVNYQKMIKGWLRGKEAIRELCESDRAYHLLYPLCATDLDRVLDKIDQMGSEALVDQDPFVRECKKHMVVLKNGMEEVQE